MEKDKRKCRYEYAVAFKRPAFTGSEMAEQQMLIKDMADDGWEFIQIYGFIEKGNTTKLYLYFRRLKRK